LLQNIPLSQEGRGFCCFTLSESESEKEIFEKQKKRETKELSKNENIARGESNE
jgi:hypothetical protein